MLFNSFQFLLFFPVVTIIYFLLPHKFRWFHLLAASCLFYCAFIPVYILILFFTIIIDYLAGILIEQSEGKKRKNYLVLSIISNVLILAFFKYCNFFLDNFNGIFGLLNIHKNIPLLNIILPIGLSFHTFQAMSYTIEVYRGNHKAERHFGIYALYVMFYPQLVAGPIERPQNLLFQFHEDKKLEYENISDGLKFILWGMFKKVVIADRLAIFTDPVFNYPHHYSPIVILLGLVFFAFQIYCDFSGYSDIAIGTARVMGFNLMTNFNRPYSSKSISEFWRRWHISLSSWLSDYVYTPLAIKYRNLGIFAIILPTMITFLISGFWHGAGWKYIIFGGLFGIAVCYEIFTKKIRKKVFKLLPLRLGNLLSQFFFFSYLCFCYIFFRSNTLNDAFYITKKVGEAVKQIFGKLIFHKHATVNLPVNLSELSLGITAILFLETVHLLQRHNHFETLKKSPVYIRWGIYYSLIFIIAYFGVFENRTFIYFQF